MAKESEIISKIRRMARHTKDVAVGIGDDAAVIEHGGATDLLACSDLSIEGVHFRLDWMSPRLVGRKALAVTLSDVAAMGGKNRFALVSLAVPPSTNTALADEVMQGIFEIADAHQVAVIGGDTSRSPIGLFVDTVAIGECARGGAVRRGGATVGDAIYVTGSLGASTLGLRLLESGYRLREKNDIQEDQPVQEAIRKHLQPEPRLAFGQALGESRLATAMIDISDGLSTDLSHILTESRCGAVVHAAALPIASCAKNLLVSEFAFEPLEMALHSGEEYELLFTARAENRHAVVELAEAHNVEVTEIGRIVEGGELLLEGDGKTEPLRPSGYEHDV